MIKKLAYFVLLIIIMTVILILVNMTKMDKLMIATIPMCANHVHLFTPIVLIAKKNKMIKIKMTDWYA